MRQPIDINRVRASCQRLEAHAAQHPEVFAHSEAQFRSILRKDQTMADESTLTVAVRLPSALVERIDAHALKLRKATPGIPVNRSDAIRVLLQQALDAAEAQKGGKSK